MEEPITEEAATGVESAVDSGIVSPNYTTKLDGSIEDTTTSEDGTGLQIEADLVQEDGTQEGDFEVAVDECIDMEGEIIEGADLEGEVMEEGEMMAGEIYEAADVEGDVIEGDVLDAEVVEEEVMDQPMLDEPLTPATDVSGTTKSLTDSGRGTPVSQNADSATFSSSEKSTPGKRAKGSDMSGRKIDYDSLSSSSGSVKGGNFPQRNGIHWRKGERLEAMDYLDTWFPAKIRSINEEEMQVLIHFDGWNQRYDEWIDMMSDRIRPLVRHSERKERKKPPKGVRGGRQSSKAISIPLNMRLHHEHKIGDAVYAKWTDCKMYPAKITNIMPTGSYEVIFYDGFKKLVQPINIRPMPSEYRSFEISPVPEVMLKKAKMKLDHTDLMVTPEEKARSGEKARSETRGDSSAEKEGKVKKIKKRKQTLPGPFEEQAVAPIEEPPTEMEAEIKSEPVSTQTEYTENKVEDLCSELKEEPGLEILPPATVAGVSPQAPVVGPLPPKAFVVESDHNHFKCPYEGCPKGFRKEHLLDYHIKYYHINGGGPPPPPAKRRRKTTSTCSTESENFGGSRKSAGKKNRNLSAESGIYASEVKLEYPDTPLSCATETGEISTQTAADVGEDSNIDVMKQDSLEESSVTDAEDFLKPDELVNCICDFQEENGLMIQCEVCMCWQHAACFGISENTLPKTYVCFVCENPPGVRDSARYIHEQDWFKTGEIPSFSFLSLPPMTDEQCSTVKSTHTLVTEIHQLNAVLHSLKLQLKILRTKDEAKLKLWRVDWESVETDTLETCHEENLEENDSDVKPLLETLEQKLDPDQSTKTDIKDKSMGVEEHKFGEVELDNKTVQVNQKPMENTISGEVEDKPLDLSGQHSKATDNNQEPVDLSLNIKNTSDSGCNGSDFSVDKKREIKSEKVEEDNNEKITRVTADLDTDADTEVESKADTDKKDVTNVNGAKEPLLDPLNSNKSAAESEETTGDKAGLTVKEEKAEVKFDLNAEECNYSESTESVVEDSIEVCERNLLNYIAKVQGEISDRFDKIEEQIEMLEAMEAMQSRQEQPTPETVFNDMPQLKRSVRNMQDDLFKVKKMAVFH